MGAWCWWATPPTLSTHLWGREPTQRWRAQPLWQRSCKVELLLLLLLLQHAAAGAVWSSHYIFILPSTTAAAANTAEYEGQSTEAVAAEYSRRWLPHALAVADLSEEGFGQNARAFAPNLKFAQVKSARADSSWRPCCAAADAEAVAEA